MGLLQWHEGARSFVLGYSDDTALRPILVALGGHLVVVVAPLVLVGWRTGSVGAWSTTAALLGASVWLGWVEWTHRGRPGALVAALAGSWIGGLAFAWFCERTGVL